MDGWSSGRARWTSFAISGNIRGNRRVDDQKLCNAGTGSIILSGSNSFSGGVTLDLGLLHINSTNALGAAEGLFTINAGKLDNTSGAALTNVNDNAMQWNGDFTFNGAANLHLGNGDVDLGAGARTVTVVANTLTIGGAITNSCSLTKSGVGTLTLSGANTYGGLTTVNNGTLSVNGSLAGGATVESAATLGGIGNIAGAVEIKSGGFLAPGASIGTMTLGTVPTLAGTIIAEINSAAAPNADKVVLTSGTLTYGGNLILTNIGTGIANGTVFDLFDAPGDSYAGSFSITLPSDGATHWNTANLLVDGSISFTNHAPVAKAITNGAPAGVTSIIRIIGGKPEMAPTDADGDALLVSSVQNPSALLSATVTTDGTNILYTPGLNASGADTVQYVVSDGFGGFGTNTMYVTVTGQSFNIVSGPTLVNNQFQVTFAGIPNYTYTVDDSTNSVSGPWAFYTNLTAGTNGLFQLVATNDPPAAQRFFRTRAQLP